MFQLLIPVFNQLTNKELSLIGSPHLFVWLIVIPVFTGLISGLYPAFYMSSLKPISMLKSKTGTNLSAVNIRKGLVVFQFTISTVLILTAILIGQQMNYISNLDLGFNKDQKIVLPIQTNEANSNINTLKNELLGNTQVLEAAYAGTYPGIETVTSMLFYPEGNSDDEKIEVYTAYAEPGYMETLDIELLAGREFSSEFQNDQHALIMNESAIKQLGYTVEEATGREVYFELQNKTHAMTIIGLVKDYHFQSLHQKIKPLALTVHPIFKLSNGYLILDTKSSNYSDLVETINKTWNKVNANSPFVYTFLDQDFQRNYQKEELTSRLVLSFTAIAVVIACLGLFALAAYTAEQRFREIGVRKVLGASVTQIVALLSRDFMRLVIISIALSSPIGYFAMNKWLSGFAYRTDIEWWTFIYAGTATVLIALLTISFQAIKAALINPVESLRTE